MTIPTLFDITLPLLSLLSDGAEYHGKQLFDLLAKRLALTESELAEQLSPSQSRFRNRVAWACVELKLGKLIESPRPGVVKITDRGKQVLAKSPKRLDRSFLKQFPEYADSLVHALEKSWTCQAGLPNKIRFRE